MAGKSHGMNSEQASEKKNNGHKKEVEFAALMPFQEAMGKGNTTEKRDTRSTSEDFKYEFSVKGRDSKAKVARAQIALKMHFSGCEITEYNELFKSILEKCPSGDEWKKLERNKKNEIKTKCSPYFAELKGNLQDTNTKCQFLKEYIFGNELNTHSSIEDKNGNWHISHQKNVIDILCKYTDVCNSATARGAAYGTQKVVFKDREKNLNLIEVEVRYDKGAILIVAYLDRLLALLIENSNFEEKYKEKVIIHSEEIWRSVQKLCKEQNI